MLGQWWRETQPSSSNDVDHINICARRLHVTKLCKYLSNPKPDFLLCSKQCGLLIVAMQRVASWLARWERKTLPAPFVQDMLTLATRGVRLLEEFKHLNPSTWLVRAAFKLESREEFLDLFQGFLQDLIGYSEVMQGAHTCVNETCMHEVMHLILNLREDLHLLPLEAAEDRRALFQNLEQGSFAEGEEFRIACMLMEHLQHKEKRNNPLRLYSADVMYGKPELIGKGAFGEVYKATWMGLKIAVKQFEEPASCNAELKALLKTTSHVNVMRAIAYHTGEQRSRPCLLMELMKGDLDQFVHMLKREKTELPLSVSIDILLQIATGMAHLHAENVMHRDLKPANILFNRWPPMSTQHLHKGLGDFTAKIIDFGEARTHVYHTIDATAKRGTACYRAPEILHAVDDEGRARYSNKVDVFSFGMVCYKLLTKSDPCLSMENAVKGNCSELKFPSCLPRALIILMSRCWATPHQRRPSFAEICDFLALFKSIVLNTVPANGGTPLLYLGIRDDLLVKLVAFLGKEWLMEEAISLGIRPEFAERTNRIEIDEPWLRLQITNKLAASPKVDNLRWLCWSCIGAPI